MAGQVTDETASRTGDRRLPVRERLLPGRVRREGAVGGDVLEDLLDQRDHVRVVDGVELPATLPPGRFS